MKKVAKNEELDEDLNKNYLENVFWNENHSTNIYLIFFVLKWTS